MKYILSIVLLFSLVGCDSSDEPKKTSVYDSVKGKSTEEIRESLNKLKNLKFAERATVKVTIKGIEYEFKTRQYYDSIAPDLKKYDEKQPPLIEGNYESINIGFSGFLEGTNAPYISTEYNLKQENLSEELKILLKGIKLGQCNDITDTKKAMKIKLPISKNNEQEALKWEYLLGFRLTNYFVSSITFKAGEKRIIYASSAKGYCFKTPEERMMPEQFFNY